MATKLRILKNDTVKIIAGSDKGKQGKVLAVYPKTLRIKVEGVNIVTRHMKPTQSTPGSIVTSERPIAYSNVQLIDTDGKATRVAMKAITAKGKTSWSRVAKSNKKEIVSPVQAPSKS